MEINGVNPVLIVGAGPTGLMMACELARYNIPFRIIDKKSERTTTTNAAAIQTRTLEIFSDIGIVDRFLEKGIKCKGMHFNFKNKNIFNLSIDVIDSIYKFILMLPQCETEAVLESHLNDFGFAIERNKTLTSLQDMGDYVEAVVDGETILCSWVIGCDGAHSAVRDQIGVTFPGEDIEDRFVVADLHVMGVSIPDAVNVFADVGTVLAFFPFGKDRYRLAANLRGSNVPKELSEQDVKMLVNQRAGDNVNVTDVSWASPFWIHSKLVTKMQKGRVFLAGDAAHIHSPVGGQGMNTGLQDVYNLAWKLASVMQGKTDKKLLESYELERRPVIQAVVSLSERATKLMISENKTLVWLRNRMLKFVNSQAWIKKKIAMRLTQLLIRYVNSPIIDYAVQAPNGAPKTGERAPDVILDDGKHFHRYFENRRYNALIFTGTNERLISDVDFDALKNKIKSQHPDVINVIIISAFNAICSEQISDTSHQIHRCYKINAPIIYFVRPDSYISKIETHRWMLI